MDAKSTAKKGDATQPVKKDRIVISQGVVPTHSLKKALTIAQGLWEFRRQERATQPSDCARLQPRKQWMENDHGIGCGLWSDHRRLQRQGNCTYRAWQANSAPTTENDDDTTKVEAALKPALLNQFYTKYDGSKFPKDDVDRNALITIGFPRDRTDSALDILKENGKFAGLVRDTKTGPFVFLKSSTLPQSISNIYDIDDETSPDFISPPEIQPTLVRPTVTSTQRVFLTHGKNMKILEQIKEIVRYGKFEPVISVEHETVSKPVPEKVLDDMRSCDAAIIHVAQEGVLADVDGKLVPQINGNVLIEIGAAMALYKRKFILLVEEGVNLPSNLQGLYECRYSGDSLGGFATMKLLKAFNDFTSA